MTYDELKKKYGTQRNIAAAVGLSPMRASVWSREGVPIEYQCVFQVITRGRFKADKELLESLPLTKSRREMK